MIIFLTALAALVFGSLAVSALTYAFFWYEAASGSHRQTLVGISGGRVGLLIARCTMAGWLSLLLIYVLYPLFLIRGLWRPKDQDAGRTPVLFVHGLFHNASAWLLYVRWFRAQGFSRCYALSYDSIRADFSSSAVQVAEAVRDISRDHPGQKIALVGHSLGGLLIRKALTMPEVSDNVLCAVTLGAPHGGSKLAAFGLGRTARGLLPGSPVMRELTTDAVPRDVPFLSLSSPTDNMVLPQDNLQKPADAPWIETRTEPVSHVQMLYHKPTALLACRFIAEQAGNAAGDRSP